jgi:hypothetical protein
MEIAAPEIVRILIGRAQCGDRSMEAAKYVLERIAPSRRGRLVEIEGFEVRTPADVPLDDGAAVLQFELVSGKSDEGDPWCSGVGNVCLCS